MSQHPPQPPSAQSFGQQPKDQQAYGQQAYGQQAYGQQPPTGYGPAPQMGPQQSWCVGRPTFPLPPQKSSNGLAAAFLLIGGFIGFTSMFLNWVSRLPYYNGFQVANENIGHGAEGVLIPIGLYLVFAGGFVCLVIGVINLIPATGHRGVNVAALVFAALMTIASIVALAGFSSYLEGAAIGHYFLLIAGFPCLIGAIIGVVRK